MGRRFKRLDRDGLDATPLADCRVLLVADADRPGRKAMAGIAAHLAKAAAVSIYEPDGDDASDIADWLEADGPEATRDRIEAAAVAFDEASDAGEVEPASDEAGDAEPVSDASDWKAKLLAAVKTDPGAPFETHCLEPMCALRRSNQPEWQRLRSQLKEAKVPVLVQDL